MDRRRFHAQTTGPEVPAPSVNGLCSSADLRARLPAGTRLFDDGAPAHLFWLIDAGQVALDTLVPGTG